MRYFRILPVALVGLTACAPGMAPSTSTPVTTAASSAPVVDVPVALTPGERPQPAPGEAAVAAPTGPGSQPTAGSPAGGTTAGGTASSGGSSGGGGSPSSGGGSGGGGSSGGGGTIQSLPASPAASPSATPLVVPVSQPIKVIGVTANAAAAGFQAARAVDGDPATEWGGGTALTLELNQAAAIAGLTLKTGPTPAGAQLLIETSVDGASWSQAASTTVAGWGLEAKPLPAHPVGKFVRLRYDPGSATRQTMAVFEVTLQAIETGNPTIHVDPGTVLHAATSHVLATCRNHVAGDFKNGAAKLAKLKELTPTWGEKKYLYRIGHGPTDGRTDYAYMTGFHFEQAWDSNNAYPYDDLRNALADANALGADQMHVVNFGTSDPAEAGRYVSYLNHDGDANRAAHPVAQQDVRMFELGNEISWDIVRGHDQYAPTETAYATRAKQFAQAMRAASDVPIQIGAVASTNSNWFGSGWSGGATTVKNILTTMGSDVDFLIFHGYPSWPMAKGGDLLTLMAQNEWNRQKLEAEIKPAIKQYAGGRDVYLANTEFFSNLYDDVAHARGMLGALYSADSLILAMNEDIRTAVQFCFDHKDMADASFFVGDDPNATTPIFKLQALLAKHWGDQIVSTRGAGLPSTHVTGASASLELPRLAFSAAASGGKVWLAVVNRTNEGDVTADVDLGFTPSAVTAYTLAGSNGWDSTDATVGTSAGSLAGHVFPRASVTVFEATR